MDDLLHWTNHLDLLQTVVVLPQLGIISDFDGTLSEFADSAVDAIIAEENARALDYLAECVKLVALVSGRATVDLRNHFERPWLRYYGSHGLERWQENAVQIVPAVEEWRVPLARLLAEFTPPPNAGVYVENKGVTAAIHYRRAADPESMRKRLLDQLQPLCAGYGFVLSEGRFIWEIKPPVSLSKGTAVQALIEDHQLDGAIFLGDDVTDLSAMAYLRSARNDGQVLAVNVGVIYPDSELTGMREACDVSAHGPGDVARLLLWIGEQLHKQ